MANGEKFELAANMSKQNANFMNVKNLIDGLFHICGCFQMLLSMFIETNTNDA